MQVCNLQNISISLGKRSILKDVSLTLEEGQLIVLLGANGAGKTTLLKILTKKIENFGGQVLLHGRDLRSWKPSDLAKMRSVLSQEQMLDFAFTSKEVIALGRFPHKSKKAVDEIIVERSLRQVGLLSFAKRLYPSLSGGEKQRVQLARVLAQLGGHAPAIKGSLLLLDEPTSSLDISHQHLVLDIARRFARAGAAVFAILHDLNLAARYADQIYVLNKGRILSEGKPAQALKKDVIAKAFGVEVDIFSHPQEDYPYIVVHKIIKEEK